MPGSFPSRGQGTRDDCLLLQSPKTPQAVANMPALLQPPSSWAKTQAKAESAGPQLSPSATAGGWKLGPGCPQEHLGPGRATHYHATHEGGQRSPPDPTCCPETDRGSLLGHSHTSPGVGLGQAFSQRFKAKQDTCRHRAASQAPAGRHRTGHPLTRHSSHWGPVPHPGA